MTEQEAIENLRYLISDNCTDTQNDYVEEIELAIKVLKKQIPRKPTDVCTPVITWGLCPSVKANLICLADNRIEFLSRIIFAPIVGKP